jgi:O-antigen/teichoic acid export membrane protein
MVRLAGIDLAHTDKYYAFAGNVVRSLARLLMSIMVARLAGADGYGSFVLLVAIEVIAVAIMGSLVGAPLLTLAPGCPAAERDQLAHHVVRRGARWAAGASLLLLLPVLLVFGRRFADPVTILGFVTSTGLWCACVGPRCWRQATFRSRRSFWADTAGLSLLVGLVAVTAIGQLEVTAFYWWASALGAAATLVGLGRPAGPAGRVPAKLASRFRSMGFHMTTGTLANTLASRIQPFVLAVVATTDMVARFGAAATLIGPIRLLSMTVAGVLRPRFSLHLARRGPGELNRLTALCVSGFVMIGTLFVGTCIVLGDWPVVLLFGEEFRGVARVLPWAGAFATLEAIGTVLLIFLQTARHSGPALVTALRTCTTVVALVTLWPACAWFGAVGAFAATTLVELLFVLLLADRLVRDGRQRALSEAVLSFD